MTKIQKESNSQRFVTSLYYDDTVVTYDKDTKRKQFTTVNASRANADALL